MKLRITVDGDEIPVLLNSIEIQKELSGRSSTATFAKQVEASTNVYGTAKYDEALYDVAFDFSTAPQQQAEVIIYNDDDDTKVFRGFITNIKRDLRSAKVQFWTFQCIGLEYLLENVTINRSWTGKTDRQIIQDAFGDLLPEITTDDSTVAELSVAIDFEAKDKTLRELVEGLSEISGAEWRVTEEKELSYRAAGSVSAPFGFGSDPDDEDDPPLKKWMIQSRERQSPQFANKVTVLGAFAGTAGAELRAVAENTDSQADLGRVIEAVVVARDIDNQPALNLAAEIELEQRGVRESIEFEFFEDGLEVGMLVVIDSPAAGLNEATFVINTLTIHQSTQDRTRYKAQVGDCGGPLG